MILKEVIFKTNVVQEFVTYFSKVKFPELQISTELIFASNKNIEFQCFQVYQETNHKNEKLISYKIDFLDNERSLTPVGNILGIKKEKNNETVSINVDYWAIDHGMVTGYTLFENGQVPFRSLTKIS